MDDLRAGRPEAFRRLYDEQHPAIYNLCARILGDREEAKDVTQETFITAFSNPPAADPSLKLRAWLYRVATNACFNQLRARKQIGGDGMIGEIPAPVDEFARAETAAAVEQTLGQMNERYRTALVLKDLHGLPPEEIAAVMEVSRPTADVLVHRARASFKTAFAKLGGDVPAPANLGLVLAPLAVPAALHIMPPMPHVALPVHPVPPHLAHLAQQPHTGGVLNKLATAATAKIAIGAAAVTLAVGGGVIAVRDVERSHRPQGSGAPSPAASFTALAPAASALRHHAHSVGHDAAEHTHDGSHDSTHTADHIGDHAGETAQHSGDHSTSTGTHDGGSTSTSTGTSDHSTNTTDTHDSTSMTGDGDHTSGE